MSGTTSGANHPGPLLTPKGGSPSSTPSIAPIEASTTAVLSTQRARTKSVSCSTGKP